MHQTKNLLLAYGTMKQHDYLVVSSYKFVTIAFQEPRYKKQNSKKSRPQASTEPLLKDN